MTEAAFLTDLHCKLVHPGWWRQTWQLTEDLLYYSAIAEEIIRVPTRFQTDFASVPRLPIIWWIYGGLMQRPAVVHDWIYHKRLYPRRKGDRIFQEAIEVEGGGLIAQQGMYAGVRAFGFPFYGRANNG